MSTQVTVTERPVNHFAVRLAAVHLRRMKASIAAYEEDVDEWYRSGPGRSPKWHTFIEGDDVYQANVGGQGYAFPHCIHGTSRWTDYDNICGPCEDSLTVYQEALYAGHRDAQTYLSRMSVYRLAHDEGAPKEVCDAIADWAIKALPTNTPIRRNLP